MTLTPEQLAASPSAERRSWRGDVGSDPRVASSDRQANFGSLADVGTANTDDVALPPQASRFGGLCARPRSYVSSEAVAVRAAVSALGGMFDPGRGLARLDARLRKPVAPSSSRDPSDRASQFLDVADVDSSQVRSDVGEGNEESG
jgi:hypothetical protein